MRTLRSFISQAARYGALGLLCTLAACSDTEPLENAVDNSGTGKIELANGIFSQKDGTWLYPEAVRFHWASFSHLNAYGQNQVVLSHNSEGFISGFYRLKENNLPNTEYAKAYTFDYLESLEKVRMTDYTYEGEPETQFIFNIGPNGFANTAQETYLGDGEQSIWKFDYDAEGHLLRANDGDILTCYYDADGNLVRFTIDDGETTETGTLTYSNTPNQIRYMLFSDSQVPNSSLVPWFHPVLQYAYYAGLLGKPSPNLPATLHIDYGEKGYSPVDYRITFENDIEGYPTVRYTEY